MGYARSKPVGEYIVRDAARAGARSHVLRVGQVVGDTVEGDEVRRNPAVKLIGYVERSYGAGEGVRGQKRRDVRKHGGAKGQCGFEGRAEDDRGRLCENVLSYVGAAMRLRRVVGNGH